MKRSGFTLRDLLAMVLLAAGYFFAATLGLKLAIVHKSATAVWPPTGISLAVLLFFGRRLWPGIFIGAFLANLTTEGNLFTSLGIAAGNTLEAVIGSTLVGRFAGGVHLFDRTRQIFKFVLLAVLGSTLISATIGVASLSLGGYAPWARFGSIWLTWWLGDASGAILFAPPLLLLAKGVDSFASRGSFAEGLVLLLITLFTGLFFFGGFLKGEAQHFPPSFMGLPVILWAALRFGQRGACLSSLFLSGFALWGTLEGYGPFVLKSPNTSLLILQAFMSVLTLTGLIVAAVVQERGRAESELRDKARDLERLSRAKGDFVTMVTHELRIPLSAIQEGVNLVRDGIEGQVSEGQKETLTIVKRNIDRLSRMVSNVLDFQRLESGIIPFNFGWHNPGGLVRETAETVRFDAEKKEICLEVKIPEHLEKINCDSDRIRQVLLNLAENAVKFTKSGGWISIGVASTPEEIILKVEDSGVGVAEKDREKIFELFAQSERGKARRPGGFGVGLAVCKQIVEGHGGRIWVEGKGGEGSLFIVSLPRNAGKSFPRA